ncbi:MAG: thioredoxin domain-containing protein [Betaproteobacteria bacterium]|nr:thioredoxin domain-containing protein [Betaproteobacteria bacterium]
MTNRLGEATSPYLRQHADNPVAWQPWDEAALAQARREHKPILLSIGYSACHWCHVMAHESFEDPEVAAVMNAHFVNVKVDREERPDLDQVYQAAHALLTRRPGGWPLTMFLTPDGVPYFGGTYFPKHGRHGLPGLLELLPRVAAAYHEQPEAIRRQSAGLQDALASLEPRAPDGDALPRAAAAIALDELKRSFDPVHGGFGAAPKFPHPVELEFCLRAWADTGDAAALDIVRTTLLAMAAGGIHDQLGGGFCRYSVDGQWAIPHFEKMLYDNGPLLGLYADAARSTGDRRFADAARGIVGWLDREMRAPDGAFRSSLDADSEGEEGKFYVWTQPAFRAALSADEYAVAAPVYGLDGPPNFEDRAWHLRVAVPPEQVAAALGISLPDAQTRLVAARGALFAARATRVRPGQDDKVLTAWNALAIAGLARASRALAEPRWADLARAALDTLKRTAWRDGRLCATRHGDRAAGNGFLDDYAFLLAALLEMMQTRFAAADFDWACALADVLLAQFEDPAGGGFFFTSHDHETLIHRSKPGHDAATPSGNGVAAQALIALGHLAAVPRYVTAAERALRCFSAAIAGSPRGFGSLQMAIDDAESPPATVLLAGADGVCAQWQAALERDCRPRVRVFSLGTQAVPPPLVKGPVPPAGAAAWICRGTHCLPPVATLEEIVAALGG